MEQTLTNQQKVAFVFEQQRRELRFKEVTALLNHTMPVPSVRAALANLKKQGQIEAHLVGSGRTKTYRLKHQ
ncbi:hypothetical protein ACQ4M3_09515 [Leptolyngbya sp. AN03gr2]|uniref:hypothetical protein n=1 Tax=Leptolyngbya sp. AN03gr2 TaxID=3423364 RepID=UPI003D31432B